MFCDLPASIDQEILTYFNSCFSFGMNEPASLPTRFCSPLSCLQCPSVLDLNGFSQLAPFDASQQAYFGSWSQHHLLRFFNKNGKTTKKFLTGRLVSPLGAWFCGAGSIFWLKDDASGFAAGLLPDLQRTSSTNPRSLDSA